MREKVQCVFLTSDSSNKENKKRSYAEFSEQFRKLYQNVVLFDAGASQFEGEFAILFCKSCKATAICFMYTL